MALLTAISDEDARGLIVAYPVGALESFEALAAGSVNSNFAVRTAGPGGRRLFLRLYEEQDRAGAEAETAMVERLAAAGVPTRAAGAPQRRRPRLGGPGQAGGPLSVARRGRPVPARG